jgi:hypothetical protein
MKPSNAYVATISGRRRRPRLPWKRGPAARQVAINEAEVLKRLEASPRHFFSLRCAANIFGLSTQPLRDWSKREYLKRDGPRFQISKHEIQRIVGRFAEKAGPFDMRTRRERFHRHLTQLPRAFGKLASARFLWPKGRTALTPKELSNLIRCHPSLIVKAIKCCGWLGRRHSRCRWEITRQAWNSNFPDSLITETRLPPLPQGELLSTAQVAGHLRACGMARIEQRGVCKLIKDGLLEGERRSPNGRNWFVRKESLKKYRQRFEKTIDTVF